MKTHNHSFSYSPVMTSGIPLLDSDFDEEALDAHPEEEWLPVGIAAADVDFTN